MHFSAASADNVWAELGPDNPQATDTPPAAPAAAAAAVDPIEPEAEAAPAEAASAVSSPLRATPQPIPQATQQSTPLSGAQRRRNAEAAYRERSGRSSNRYGQVRGRQPGDARSRSNTPRGKPAPPILPRPPPSPRMAQADQSAEQPAVHSKAESKATDVNSMMPPPPAPKRPPPPAPPSDDDGTSATPLLKKSPPPGHGEASAIKAPPPAHLLDRHAKPPPPEHLLNPKAKPPPQPQDTPSSSSASGNVAPTVTAPPQEPVRINPPPHPDDAPMTEAQALASPYRIRRVELAGRVDRLPYYMTPQRSIFYNFGTNPTTSRPDVKKTYYLRGNVDEDPWLQRPKDKLKYLKERTPRNLHPEELYVGKFDPWGTNAHNVLSTDKRVHVASLGIENVERSVHAKRSTLLHNMFINAQMEAEQEHQNNERPIKPKIDKGPYHTQWFQPSLVLQDRKDLLQVLRDTHPEVMANYHDHEVLLFDCRGYMDPNDVDLEQPDFLIDDSDEEFEGRYKGIRPEFKKEPPQRDSRKKNQGPPSHTGFHPFHHHYMLRYKDPTYNPDIAVFDNKHDPRSYGALIHTLEYLLDKREVRHVLVITYCLAGNHRSVLIAELLTLSLALVFVCEYQYSVNPFHLSKDRLWPGYENDTLGEGYYKRNFTNGNRCENGDPAACKFCSLESIRQIICNFEQQEKWDSIGDVAFRHDCVTFRRFKSWKLFVQESQSLIPNYIATYGRVPRFLATRRGMF